MFVSIKVMVIGKRFSFFLIFLFPNEKTILECKIETVSFKFQLIAQIFLYPYIYFAPKQIECQYFLCDLR